MRQDSIARASTPKLLLEFPLEVSLYPNPTTQSTTIVLSGGTSTPLSTSIGAIPTILVYDLRGTVQKVGIEPIASNRYELNLSSLSKGVYLVKVSTQDETITKQLVIQ